MNLLESTRKLLSQGWQVIALKRSDFPEDNFSIQEAVKNRWLRILASTLALSLWTEAVAPQLAKEGIRIRSDDLGSNNTLRKGKSSELPLIVIPLMKLFFSAPTRKEPSGTLIYIPEGSKFKDINFDLLLNINWMLNLVLIKINI
ncbi:hypothetical protein AMS62_27175 [Bacillus sp. FJAT-18019]|nr:hypothetical protein AMS62_27175 [Bacillus sp. FJAT-18019]